MRSPFSLLVVIVFLCAGLGFSQTDRGTITGTVSDPAGAVIANAQVEAKNVDTGAVYPGATSATGNYTLGQLPAGTYEVSVTVSGFKKFVRTGVVVQVAQIARVDSQLEVGATTESVTVQAEGGLLKTESGEVSHNIPSDRLNLLPVVTLGAAGTLGNVRNPLQVVNLLPGAVFSNENTLRINGMPSSSQAIRIEGQDATNGMWREQNQVNQAGLDAIQEVAVQTSNFAAEYGQAGGGYFNYTMKSGTNNFHGGAYDYFVNEALNAGTPFTDAATVSSLKAGQHIRNSQRRNDYGFTFGGPIWIPRVYNGHDKTFFFFNFEQFRESQFITTGIATVPTVAYRQGDFSAALLGNLTIGGTPALDPLGRPVPQNGLYDPATQRTAADGSVIRDPFPNNKITSDKMDPVALKVQSLLPLPTNAQLINNYTIPGYTNFRHTTIPSIKLDHSLSQKIKVSGYFAETHTQSPSANGYTQVFTAAEPQDDVSYTTRVNYDQTLRPTLLLHLGAGLVHTTHPAIPQDFDQSTLGWAKNFYINQFPNFTGLADIPLSRGGTNISLGTGFGVRYLKDIKPTANASVTWVHGNHTFKIGGEMIVEGFPQLNFSRANGNFGFAAQQSGLPWENGRGLNSTTGFPYASFLMGRSNSLFLSAVTDSRLGNHSLGFYAQDSWKVTRKLTFDYGLRYDYVTLLREQYGRMQDAAFHLPNPAAGNRLGTVIYEATCGCQFNHTYPFAFGPRLGLAYQITPKTVFRGGVGIAYGSAPNNAFLSYSVPDFYTFGAPGYGAAATQLSDGNPYAVGNRFGNPPITWPDFSPHYPSEVAPGIRPPQSPFISIDRNAGRPPRIFQWSIGLQREIMRDLVVEAAYVGNRGAWWSAPLLATYNYNALSPDALKAYGLDITSAADRSLLTLPISSAQVIARFPTLANPNSVYPGFPASQPLNQALRPYPQWLGIPPFLGPPLGTTWYDSLQAKVTKRYSHGLDMQAAFTWQKELTSGVSSDTSYLTPAPPLINDVFNYQQNKQISGFSRPLMLVVSFNYTTPGIAGSGGFKALSWAVRDWTLGGVLRYQSGQLLRVPASNNALLRQLARTDNPASWGGGTTFWNRVPGQPLFLKDPNCHCIDPTQQLVLNPAAWTDAPAGQFGTSAAYYNDYRWQRQPSESMSIGRLFRVREKMSLQVRAEFQNIFNRLFLASPIAVGSGGFPSTAGANPAAPTTRNTLSQLTSGYGYVNWVNGGNSVLNPTAGAIPRSGQIVARFQF
jgi:hypothetical protein